MVGELDAGNPHVQFDEGAQETCDSATRLCPTLHLPWRGPGQRPAYLATARVFCARHKIITAPLRSTCPLLVRLSSSAEYR